MMDVFLFGYENPTSFARTLSLLLPEDFNLSDEERMNRFLAKQEYLPDLPEKTEEGSLIIEEPEYERI